MNEQVHVHVLRDADAFVVNLFDLSDESRIVEGTIAFEEMGLDPDRFYVTPRGGRFDCEAGTFRIRRRMPPLSAEVTEVRPMTSV